MRSIVGAIKPSDRAFTKDSLPGVLRTRIIRQVLCIAQRILPKRSHPSAPAGSGGLRRTQSIAGHQNQAK